MNNPLYSGNESGKSLSTSPLRNTGAAFAVAAPLLPHGAQPIIDEVSGACVGFIHEGAKNVWHVFEVTGQALGLKKLLWKHLSLTHTI